MSTAKRADKPNAPSPGHLTSTKRKAKDTTTMKETKTTKESKPRSKATKDHSKDKTAELQTKREHKREQSEKYMEHVEKLGWEKLLEEFHVGYKPDCQDFKMESRYVVSLNAPEKTDFYYANKIVISNVPCQNIAGAIPKSETDRETLWRMVFDSAVPNVFVLEDHNKLKKDPFWPPETGNFKDYGCMSVSNKKSTLDKDRDYQAILEVLPEGCSNSNIVRVVVVMRWTNRVGSARRRMALHLVRLLRDEKGTVLILCKDGKANTGTFILLRATLHKLMHNQPISMSDQLREIRTQRFVAVTEEEQYALAYVLATDYLQCKHKVEYTDRAKKVIGECIEYFKQKAKLKLKQAEEKEKDKENKDKDKDKDKEKQPLSDMSTAAPVSAASAASDFGKQATSTQSSGAPPPERSAYL